MDFKIDVGVQSDGYVFRLNPKTQKAVHIPKGLIVPSSMFISFDTMSDFEVMFGKSALIRQVPIALVGLSNEMLQKQGFSNIIYFDSHSQQELKRVSCE